MDQTNRRGKKFVIMRSLDIHLNMGLAEQLSEEHSRFYLYPTNGKIYDKETKRPVGHAMSLSTCIKWKGASFDDVE